MTNKLSSKWFIFQQDQLVLLNEHDQLTLPTDESLATAELPFVRKHALGQIKNVSAFCAEVDVHTSVSAPFQVVSLRKAFEWLGDEWYGAAVKAYSVLNWDKNHQFCGRCGHVTVHKPGLFERTCTVCGLAFYPRISPSIIVLIQKEDQVLMARSPHFVAGMYGLIAGFVEPGETLEETIHREVKEEVNIEIANLHYFGSQAWPFPDSLMVGFIADYAGGEIIIDQKEIEAAGWYRYDQLPTRSLTSVSIARKLIDHYVALQTASSTHHK